MRRRAGLGIVVALALAGLAPMGCESTAPVSGCVKCRCDCQAGTGTRTTTFEGKDSLGQSVELSCTRTGDCVAECARIGATTPISANCLVSR